MTEDDSSFSQYKFREYSTGFLGEGASNDSGVIENVNFQGFQVLNLWNLRK